MDKNLSPIHPGEILLEDFMKPMGISARQLAAERPALQRMRAASGTHCAGRFTPSTTTSARSNSPRCAHGRNVQVSQMRGSALSETNGNGLSA